MIVEHTQLQQLPIYSHFDPYSPKPIHHPDYFIANPKHYVI